MPAPMKPAPRTPMVLSCVAGSALGRRAGGPHGAEELHRLPLPRARLAALGQSWGGPPRRHHPGDTLRPAGAGKQPDLDLGEPDTGLVPFGRDPVMAGEAKLEAAAQ